MCTVGKLKSGMCSMTNDTLEKMLKLVLPLIIEIKIGDNEVFSGKHKNDIHTYVPTGKVIRRNKSLMLKLRCLTNNEIYAIHATHLLTPSASIQWKHKLSLSQIKACIPQYDYAQERADFQLTLTTALHTCLLLGPRNVVPLLTCRYAKQIYVVDNDANMALFALLLFGGWKKVIVVYTERSNKRCGNKIGIQDIVLCTNRNPLPCLPEFTYINLDYNGSPNREIWTDVEHIFKLHTTLKILAIAGARRSFVVPKEKCSNLNYVFGKTTNCTLIHLHKQPQMMHWWIAYKKQPIIFAL